MIRINYKHSMSPEDETIIQHAQQLRLERFKIAVATQVFAIFVLILVCRIGTGTMTAVQWSLYLGLVTGFNLLVFGLYSTHLNLHFSDPSLTREQILLATFSALVPLHALYEVRPIMQMIYLPAFCLGMLRLTLGQYLRLVVEVMGLYGALLCLEYSCGRPNLNLQYELTLYAIFGVLLTWFACFGGFVTDMRKKMRDQTRKLQEARARNQVEIKERERVVRLLDAAITQSPSGIIIADAPDVTIRIANPAAKKIRGESGLALTGIDYKKHSRQWRTFHGDGSVYPPEDLPLSRAVLKGETTQNEEVIIRDVKGQDHWVSTNAAPIFDETGETITAGIVIFHDISDGKQAEAALKRSEEKFRDIFENLLDVYFRTTLDGTIKEASPSAELFSGYSIPELIGNRVDMLYMDPRDREGLLAQLKKYGKIRDYKLVFKRKNGEPYDVSINANIYFGANGLPEGMTGTIRDITESKKIEAALKRSEALYREYFEEILSGAFITSASGRLLECNQEYLRIFGFSSVEEALACPVTELYQDPARRDEFLAAIKKNKKVKHFESLLRRKDGFAIHILENAVGVFDGTGNLVTIRGYLVDISELKTMEIQLSQAQRMEAIGSLAGGIAHDFNNILSGIFGFAQLAKNHINRPDKVVKNIDRIMKGAQKAADLVQQILAFSRRSEHKKEPLKVAEVMEEALQLIRATLPSTIIINERIDSESMVLAEPAKIHQVIMNLCTNAYHAMGAAGGVLTVALEETVMSDMAAHPGLKPGKHLKLVVKDTGYGMDSQTLAKIFDPYFTTKAPGSGTGLGLSVVFGIVQEYNGSIHVESEKGKGSVFTVYLPVIDTEDMAPAGRIKEEVQPTGGTESILVVDDDDSIRISTQSLLEYAGYRVTSFSDSTLALKAFETDPGQFDLIVTDMTMPHMTGLELAETVLAEHPDQPIVLCTGHSDLVNRQKAMAMGISGYFKKPLITKQLLEVIRSLLDKTNGNPN